MKLRTLALTSLSVVALAFTACGGDKKEEAKPAVQHEVKAETPAPAPAPEAKPAEPKAEAPAPAPQPAPAPKAETASAPDGAKLFAKCQACHGAHGEKEALGKSQVIQGWDKAKLVEALKGYKAGTRNAHGMGGLMKGQVAPLSDADIEALAEYISNLK